MTFWGLERSRYTYSWNSSSDKRDRRQKFKCLIPHAHKTLKMFGILRKNTKIVYMKISLGRIQKKKRKKRN